MASKVSSAPPIVPQRSTWLEWWPVIVMMLGTLLSYADRAALAVLSPMILADTHMTAQSYGEVISAFSFAYTISTVVWGSLIDRVGLRFGMAISVAIWMVSSASHSLVSTFLGFAVARAALGAGEGAMFPGGFRTAMDSLPPHKQARGIAIAYSGSSAGSIVAPLMVMPIAIAFGWRIAFLAIPALALIWLVLWLGTVRIALRRSSGTLFEIGFPECARKAILESCRELCLGRAAGRRNHLSGATLSLARVRHVSGEARPCPVDSPCGARSRILFLGWIADRYAPGNPRPAWLFAVMAVFALPEPRSRRSTAHPR